MMLVKYRFSRTSASVQIPRMYSRAYRTTDFQQPIDIEKRVHHFFSKFSDGDLKILRRMICGHGSAEIKKDEG